MSGFDYENARLDILDSGGDPDYLSHTDPEKRDAYLRKMGLRPEDYGGGSRDRGAGAGNADGCPAADRGTRGGKHPGHSPHRGTSHRSCGLYGRGG